MTAHNYIPARLPMGQPVRDPWPGDWIACTKDGLVLYHGGDEGMARATGREQSRFGQGVQVWRYVLAREPACWYPPSDNTGRHIACPQEFTPDEQPHLEA